MAREDTAPEVYLEAAQYYLGKSKESEAFEALRTGIKKTGSQELIDYYEAKGLLRRVDGAQPMDDCFSAILSALGETK